MLQADITIDTCFEGIIDSFCHTLDSVSEGDPLPGAPIQVQAHWFTQVVSGVIVLALAGFAPWLALKVVHFTGAHASQLHAMSATTAGGAMAVGRMGQKAVPAMGAVTSKLSAGAGSDTTNADTSGSPGSSAQRTPTSEPAPGGPSGAGGTPGGPGASGGPPTGGGPAPSPGPGSPSGAPASPGQASPTASLGMPVSGGAATGPSAAPVGASAGASASGAAAAAL